MLKVYPESDVSVIKRNDQQYTIEHLRSQSNDKVAVWRDDYLVGTADIDHEGNSIDIAFQKTEGDWHETQAVYDKFDDVISVAEYIIDC